MTDSGGRNAASYSTGSCVINCCCSGNRHLRGPGFLKASRPTLLRTRAGNNKSAAAEVNHGTKQNTQLRLFPVKLAGG